MKGELEIDDSFSDERVLAAVLERVPWYANFKNYVVSEVLPDNLSFQQRKKFLRDVEEYFWEELYLFQRCADGIIRRCISEDEVLRTLEAAHASPVGGHHAGDRTTRKVLQSGYYWPTLFKDCYEFVKRYDQCKGKGPYPSTMKCL